MSTTVLGLPCTPSLSLRSIHDFQQYPRLT